MAQNTGIVATCWFLANFLGVGLLVFADTFFLRLLGWAWVSLALSMSGLVTVGAMFHEINKDAKDHA